MRWLSFLMSWTSPATRRASCDAREFCWVVQAAQVLVDAVAVVRGRFRLVQGLPELEDLLVDVRDHHRQAILLVQFVGEVDFRQIELRQEEEAQDEEAAQESDAREAREHRHRDDGRLCAEEEVHRVELRYARNHLGDDGPEGDLHGLRRDGRTVELHAGEADGIGKIVEKRRDVLVDARREGRTANRVERSAEQDDCNADGEARHSHRHVAQPEQEEQEHRRAKAHAERAELIAEWMDARLTGQRHDEQHAYKDEEFPVFTDHVASSSVNYVYCPIVYHTVLFPGNSCTYRNDKWTASKTLILYHSLPSYVTSCQ